MNIPLLSLKVFHHKWAASANVILITLILAVAGCDTSSSAVEKWEWSFSTDFGRLPLWSPDGERILFGDDRQGSPGLYIWTPGGDPRRIEGTPANHNWDYGWSPSGDRIGFTSPGEAGSQACGIYIVNLDDGNVTRPLDRGRDLSWYFDGSAVAVRIDNPANGFPGIYLVDIETGDLQFVDEGYLPACSPVNSQIAYNESEINGRMFLIDAELEPLPITEDGAYRWRWSADGSTIFCAVNNYPSGNLTWNIFRITNPADDRQIEKVVEWAQYPAPDRTGSRVAFMRISNSSWRGLWLYSDGQGDERIADFGQNPDFNPWSDRIAVNSPESGIRILVR